MEHPYVIRLLKFNLETDRDDLRSRIEGVENMKTRIIKEEKIIKDLKKKIDEAEDVIKLLKK